MTPTAATPDPWQDRWLARWQRFAAATVRAFHRYANWLVGITWRRFALMSLLLIVAAAILQNVPPFSWRITETMKHMEGREPQPPKAPKPAAEPRAPREAQTPREPVIRIEKPATGASGAKAARGGFDIAIDEHVIRITQRAAAASTPASGAASGAASHISEPITATARIDGSGIAINLPPGSNGDDTREAVRGAIEDARDAIQEAVQAQRDAIEAARAAKAEAADAMREAMGNNGRGVVQTTRRLHWGDSLTELALLWVLGSALIKITYKGRVQAEVKAAQATETAEAESLKRQVVEARMAAMQAQVEPHFLFNTLASIDHLIETDPAKASVMQKNLIALLRASMPTMREASDGGARDLARELAMIRPYLEILKVRMEERLTTSIDVSEGLLSAEFPPMMIQTLVENAIKHGLEPKPEGGSLIVRAEIVHGKLAVSVADTGLGFGRAATAGTGVGLANIRERLQLLYGTRASLTVAENQPSGTRVTVTVPYKTLAGGAA